MVVMRHACFGVVLTTIALTVAGLGISEHNPAWAAVLDGFSINTQDKAVTVTLYTDQRTQYTTENQGKQFAIILPEAQLSKEQLDNGLPVVIDNKNQFIGRAVPTAEGKVKIIFPNLPANDYSVSIQQKQKASNTVGANIAKPHPAVQTSSSQFEQIAAKFPKSVAVTNTPKASTSNKSASTVPMRLSPVSTRSQNGTFWNPYVVKMPERKPVVANRPAERPEALPSLSPSSASNPLFSQAPAYQASQIPPVNTLSVADTYNRALQTQPAPAPPKLKDPLWYLHSLPPADAGKMPADNLSGLALDPGVMAANPAEQAVKSETEASTVSKPQKSTIATLMGELKDVARSIPRWMIITAAVFFAGLGLFGIIGALVLLRILFTQAQPVPSLYTVPYANPVTSMAAAMAANGPGMKSPFATAPLPSVKQEPPKVQFEDTVSVNALDYLKSTSDNLSQAVHNTVLVKFPNPARHRGQAPRKPRRASSNAPRLKPVSL